MTEDQFAPCLGGKFQGFLLLWIAQLLPMYQKKCVRSGKRDFGEPVTKASKAIMPTGGAVVTGVCVDNSYSYNICPFNHHHSMNTHPLHSTSCHWTQHISLGWFASWQTVLVHRVLEWVVFHRWGTVKLRSLSVPGTAPIEDFRFH